MIANTYVVKPFGISEVKVIALKGEPGGPTQEQVNTAVEEYMDDHPEAQIPDGAVTTEKLASNAVAPYADNLVSSSYVSDSEPYLFRKTFAGVREDDEIVGGSVVWNQLARTSQLDASKTQNGVTIKDNRDGTYTVSTDANGATANTYCSLSNANILITNGHKYLLFGTPTTGSVNTYYSYLAGAVFVYDYGNGLVFSAVSTGPATPVVAYVKHGTIIETPITFKPQIIDLTLMFGSTIADYIYTQEQATAGAGVALAKAWAGITADYSPYDAGSIKSVTGLTAHKMTGFNQCDEEFVQGDINTNTGAQDTSSTRCCTKNFQRIMPSETYFCQASASVYLFFYDENKSYIGYWGSTASGKTFTPASLPNNKSGGGSFENARYMKIRYDVYPYPENLCINLSDPSRNGQYEPYTVYSYPLDSSLTLRGILKLDGDSIYYDGDIYKADGTVERRYGYRVYQSGDESLANAITDGTHTVYKLTTATTETAEPYTNPQVCYPDGTEEYIDTRDVPIPVGHNTKYMRDLKKLLEGIPDAPTANGTYVLKATVSASGVTYSWVEG